MRVALVALAAILGAASVARADTSDRTEIIVSDGVSDGLMALDLWHPIYEGAGPGPFWVGFAGAVLGGPIVHAAHGDWGRAGIDLGARVVALPIGGLIGSALCKPDAHDDFLPCFGHLVIGAAIGLVGAQVLDWTVIARGPTPPSMVLSFGGHF